MEYLWLTIRSPKDNEWRKVKKMCVLQGLTEYYKCRSKIFLNKKGEVVGCSNWNWKNIFTSTITEKQEKAIQQLIPNN